MMFPRRGFTRISTFIRDGQLKDEGRHYFNMRDPDKASFILWSLVARERLSIEQARFWTDGVEA